ncbi:hypothetical protein DICSQDRAFT_150046 [Dichomitus squalens LYAD-421 SS1]|uniref:Uncharacterized protein n=1 Tax=Dichomitus squalens (strain LYAD-421) TaxID=732165 RepID=R7SMB3_DICSQ|nr:uncharacterized protein DICSQDRAFT_150046 [Dichomitus squalens LYAD-421 SS1]EJF57028.1 hypothetical protein DICSQDRAFT_150046 [Dichomitus squalens LYAD-421 SS1]
MWPSHLSRIPPLSSAAERIAQARETILLAQQCNVSELLKCAYYELLRAPEGTFGQDLSAYVHAESQSVPASIKPETDEDEENAPPPRLAASDFVRLIAAKDAL